MSKSALSILTSPAKPCSPIVTLKECLQYQASNQPHKEAYICYNGGGVRTSVTFSELYRKCEVFSSSMKRLGIQATDVVIVTSGNTVEFLIVYFGLIIMGAIPLSSGTARKDCKELLEFINKTNAVAILIPTINKRWPNFNHDELFESVGKTSLKFIISSDAETDSPGCLSFKNLVKSIPTYDTSTDETIDTCIDDVAVIMLTSGTTGVRKLVCHSYRNLYSMFKLEEPSVLPKSFLPIKCFCPANFGWLGGSPFKDVFNGTTRVTISGIRGKTDVQDMLLIAANESCNIIEMTPNVLNDIILRNIHIPKCVKCVYTGGSPIPQNFEKLLESVDYLIVGYGLLETGGIAGTYFTKQTTVSANIGGIPRSGVQIKIVDDNDRIVERGITGKILVKTPFSCVAYLGNGRLNNGEWINTEDIGYISENGELFVIGRQVDCITIGGNTAYAYEFEQIIMGCEMEEIAEVIVVPVPDEITFQQACACVIKKHKAELTGQSFLQTVSETSFGVRKPKYVLFMDSFPRNQNGKVDRRLLQKFAVERLHLSLSP